MSLRGAGVIAKSLCDHGGIESLTRSKGAVTFVTRLFAERCYRAEAHAAIGAGTQHPWQEERIMAKNQLVKDLMSQFFVPLLLTATGLGMLIFWPFSL